MEKFALTIDSKQTVADYAAEGCFVQYEKEIILEVLTCINNRDEQQLTWFASFGEDLRHIIVNVHAYRKGLEFGFTNIGFDQYGWFERPVWLDKYTIKLGDSDRYGEYSTIDLGHGPNGLWTYALHYSYGVAGGGWALSVYDKPYSSRDIALAFALNKLKKMFTEKIGSSDTTNDKQSVILSTLRAIVKEQNNLVQLSLF